MTDLDPTTLRTLARELDDRAEVIRRCCPCALHAALVDYTTHLAAEYRTWAFKAQDALTGPTVELPVLGGAA